MSLMAQLQTGMIERMSKDAIQAVVHELESLPESDHRRVLDFVARLKQQRPIADAQSATKVKPPLATEGSLLVFTGKIDGPDADWVALTREERDEELMREALGRTIR